MFDFVFILGNPYFVSKNFKESKREKFCEVLIDGIENKVKKICLWKIWNKNGMQSKKVKAVENKLQEKENGFENSK